MHNRDFEVVKDDNGNSVLVTKESVVLTEEILKMKVSQANMDRKNIVNQVKNLQSRYKELSKLIELYNEELEKIKEKKEESIEDIFSLE